MRKTRTLKTTLALDRQMVKEIIEKKL